MMEVKLKDIAEVIQDCPIGVISMRMPHPMMS